MRVKAVTTGLRYIVVVKTRSPSRQDEVIDLEDSYCCADPGRKMSRAACRRHCIFSDRNLGLNFET